MVSSTPQQDFSRTTSTWTWPLRSISTIWKCLSRTASAYIPSITSWRRSASTACSKDYTLWKQDLPFVDYIKGRGFQIIPIDVDDELHYANNFLTIAPRHIMAVGGQSEALQQRFREAGVTVEWIPLESLIDGYGAANCMTQVLQREVFQPTPTSVSATRLFMSSSDKSYSLDGRMFVGKPTQKGIYIQNDKKRIIR